MKLRYVEERQDVKEKLVGEGVKVGEAGAGGEQSGSDVVGGHSHYWSSYGEITWRCCWCWMANSRLYCRSYCLG